MVNGNGVCFRRPQKIETAAGVARPVVLAAVGLGMLAASAGAAVYYVAPSGNDGNPGVSTAAPWRTLKPVNAIPLQPGDEVLFERGGVWIGPGTLGSNALNCNYSGTSSNPIVMGAYGNGRPPILANPPTSSSLTDVIGINASWIIIQDFLLTDAHAAGVNMTVASQHNTLRRLEITRVGQGIILAGSGHGATDNYIHDLHMVVNTPGGTDDYGAIGVTLSFASDCEVAHNRIVNCAAYSYDFGTDGGVIEWWGNSDGNDVHHNWGEKSNGFAEVGGQAGNHAYDNRIAYNVSFNNGVFTVLHTAGAFGVDSTFRVENNTIVETQPHNPMLWACISFSGNTLTPGAYQLRNNIFYLGNIQSVSPAITQGWVFSHEHNFYQFLDSRTVSGFNLDPTERITDVRLKDPDNGDFHLLPDSPAVDAGLVLGYSQDFENNPVPEGSAPDVGAYEYKSIRPSPPRFFGVK